MATAAMARPDAGHRVALPPRVRTAAVSILVLAVLWGAYEGLRYVGEHADLTWPFRFNRQTMPHLHDCVGQLFEPARRNGPMLIHLLLDASLFTAREAAVGFALGVAVGFSLGVLLAHSRLARRGLLPWLVASQTVPILAVAPMVVVAFGQSGVPAWFSVSLLAAFLTFFGVTISTLRGLTSADPRAVELMHSYAAGSWALLWKLRVPASLPYLFSALRVVAPASVVGAIVGELPSSIQDGLGGAILNFNQYYILSPESLWATNLVAAVLGIAFFAVVVGAERLILRRAPENVA
jgi:NitT/TauT family transport system permease protein